MREVVLDTETTGLDYNKGDRLIEIGLSILTISKQEKRFTAI